MTEKYTFPTASEALPFIASRVLDIGQENGSRNGRVKELLNPQIVITEPRRREILTLGRKVNVFAQIAETCWVLAGRNDVEWLSAYLPRATDYSDDGKVWRGGYGPRIRGGHFGFDQLEYVVDILREDPLSRRAVIAIYDPQTDSAPGKDIPCNDFLQFQSRLGQLHLTVTVRSNDLMWGWSGINAFEWSVLQEIVASLLGIQVGTLTFNIGSLHLYEPHWDKASNLGYEDVSFPSVPFNQDRSITELHEVDTMLEHWFLWEEMCRKGQVNSELLEGWGEPLFRSWAAAIAYYWTRDEEWFVDLQGTALATAVIRTPASVLSEPVQRPAAVGVALGTTPTLNENVRAFYEFVSDLHAKKHASYGDSWKKRGEKLSILANIARKVDRLGVGDEYDSAADTWVDFLVYLAKYLRWIDGMEADPENVNSLLKWVLLETQDLMVMPSGVAVEIEGITRVFDTYADGVDVLPEYNKREFVRTLLLRVAPIARDVWLREHATEDNFDEYRGADID